MSDLSQLKAATEYQKVEASDLLRSLERFYRDYKDHHMPEYRWLAEQTIPLKVMAHDMHVNGVESFQKKYAIGIAEMRMAEIEEERAKIARNDEALEAELRNLRLATNHPFAEKTR